MPGQPGASSHRWLNVDEAARLLGITPRALYRMIDAGELAAYRVGRVLRVRASDLPEGFAVPLTRPRAEHPDTRRRPLREATIGARIIRARVRRGWGQKRLADVVGIDRSALSLIERGRREATEAEVLAIAGALGLSARDLSPS